MTSVDDLIAGMIREEGGFQKALRRVLENDLHMTVNEFSKATGISQSTMYKILEDQREPNLRTARAIIRAVKIMSGSESDKFIAVIASHQVLQVLERTTMVGDTLVKLTEYPVSTVEDAIIAALRAERDGALGVICAPIVAPTVEKIVSIPVSTVVPTNSITRAIDKV
ncbi:MAG: helix-turn-helix domain-containing protein, partial [Candidatus Methanomethylophilaceae archaeon]|nr:helix-turn-helix domain-containing protein [Candidatus Methanomethylophilaceae archaeon]